jgi:cytochrome c-type biogenesis protein CcmH
MRVVAALLAIAVVATPSALATPEKRASLPDIEDEVMCTVCGTLLEESQSPQADRERELIRRLIAHGKDKDQIKDALVAEYGENVLASPEGSGFGLLAWLIPIVGLLTALVLLWLWVRRQPRRRSTAPQLDPDDNERLERDLSSYEV